MKNRNIQLTAMLFVVALAIAPIVQAGLYPDGGPTAIEPAITIHSTDNVARGKIGTFVLSMEPANRLAGGMYVKFSVDGTAIPGVDYVAVVSPAYVGPSGYAVIQIKTLADPRGLSIPQAYSVVLTLEDGAGYAVGQPGSATMWIKP
jgi:hypothetical protein